MSDRIHFDTHSSVKTLMEAGFSEQQAEAQTGLLSNLLEQRLISRDYLDLRLDALEQRLEQRMEGLEQRVEGMEQRMEQRIIQAEQRITIRIGGMLVAAIGVLAVLIKVL